MGLVELGREIGEDSIVNLAAIDTLVPIILHSMEPPTEEEITVTPEQQESPAVQVQALVMELGSRLELASSDNIVRMARTTSPEYRIALVRNRAGWVDETTPQDELIDFKSEAVQKQLVEIHQSFGHTVSLKSKLVTYNPTYYEDEKDGKLLAIRCEPRDDELSAVAVFCEYKPTTNADGTIKTEPVPLVRTDENGKNQYAAVKGQDPRIQKFWTKQGEKYLVSVVETREEDGRVYWQQVMYTGFDLFNLHEAKKGTINMKDVAFVDQEPESNTFGSNPGKLKDLEVIARDQSYFEKREKVEPDGTTVSELVEIGKKGSLRGKIAHFTIPADPKRGMSGVDVFEEMDDATFQKMIREAPLLPLQPVDDEGEIAGEWIGVNGIEAITMDLFDYTNEAGEQKNYAAELGLTEQDLEGWLGFKYHKGSFLEDKIGGNRNYDLGVMLFRREKGRSSSNLDHLYELVDIGPILTREDFTPGYFKLTKKEQSELTKEQIDDFYQKMDEHALLPAVGGDLLHIVFGDPSIRHEIAYVGIGDYQVREKKIPGIKKLVAEYLKAYYHEERGQEEVVQKAA